MSAVPTLPRDKAELTYLELMAYLGMSRHSGGWQATTELVELCHIEPGAHILDVGCGIGKTACHLAKRHGCRVVCVDLSARMIGWAGETARREGVENRVEFKVADAQELPFHDDLFDVVINESVLSFVPEPHRALRQYLRVTKAGGFVGLNESSCLMRPSAEMIAFIERTFVGATLDTVDTWQQRLVGLGLEDIVVRAHRLTPRDEVLDRIRWFGLRGLLRNIYHMVSFSASSPTNRKLLTSLMDTNRRIPPAFYEQYAYGIFVGRKPNESPKAGSHVRTWWRQKGHIALHFCACRAGQALRLVAWIGNRDSRGGAGRYDLGAGRFHLGDGLKPVLCQAGAHPGGACSRRRQQRTMLSALPWRIGRC